MVEHTVQAKALCEELCPTLLSVLTSLCCCGRTESSAGRKGLFPLIPASLLWRSRVTSSQSRGSERTHPHLSACARLDFSTVQFTTPSSQWPT